MINTGCARVRVLGYLLTIIVFLGLAPTIAFAAPPSAFDMFKVPEFSKAKLSPSGRYLAVIRAKIGIVCVDSYGKARPENKQDCKDIWKTYREKNTIYIIDLEGGKNSVRLPIPQDYLIDWLEWANEDRLLASITLISTRNARGTKVSLGGSRIISLKRDGTDMAVMFDDQIGMKKANMELSKITSLLPKDPKHVLMPARKGGDLDLWKVNIETGGIERIAIAKKGTFFWYTDRNGKPILRFDHNTLGTKVFVYAWSDEQQDWEQIKTLKVRLRDGQEIFDFYPAAPTDVPHQIYVVSDEDEGPRRAIKIFDFKENRFVGTVFEHAKFDVEGLFLDHASGEYAGVYYYDDRLRYVLADPELQKHMDALDKFFQYEVNIDLLGFTEDGTRMILYVTGPQEPGAYHLYDIEKRQLDLLLSRRPDLAQANFGQTEILDIPVRDGSTIRGYLTHPGSGKNPAAPLIVMPHGGPERRDYFDYDPWVQFLATRGYQILQVNFRGSSGYGRDFAKAGYGQWGGLMQDDVTDAVKFLHENGRAPAERTCIYGYSYGGYAALMGGIKTPELYQCIIAGGATSDLVWSVNKAKDTYGRHSDIYEYWLRSKGDPKTDKERMQANSPALQAERIEAPILLFHGTLDEIVPFANSEKMVRALRKAKKEHRFVELKGQGHSYWNLGSEIFYWRTVEDFLDEQLKSSAAPAQGE